MFLNKSDLGISTAGKQILIIRIKYFLKIDIIFYITDQIKVFKGMVENRTLPYLKLRSQSL